jgi:hypothetical protein
VGVQAGAGQGVKGGHEQAGHELPGHRGEQQQQQTSSPPTVPPRARPPLPPPHRHASPTLPLSPSPVLSS